MVFPLAGLGRDETEPVLWIRRFQVREKCDGGRQETIGILPDGRLWPELSTTQTKDLQKWQGDSHAGERCSHSAGWCIVVLTVADAVGRGQRGLDLPPGWEAV